MALLLNSRPSELPFHVVWRGRHFARPGGPALAGITALLHARFFPSYTAERAAAAFQAAPRAPQISASGFPRRRAPPPGRGPRGAARGSRVDREVAALVQLAWRFGLGWEHLPTVGAAVARPPVALTREPAEWAEWRGLCRRAHPYTRQVFRTLKAAGLFPVAAQVGVGLAALGLGTGVDLVCVPQAQVERTPAQLYRLVRNAGFVLVELKCGYAHGYNLGTVARLRDDELHDLTDSPFHQHQMQLWLTTYLFRCTFPAARVAACYILRVGAQQTWWHPAPAWSRPRQQWLLLQLQQARAQAR